MRKSLITICLFLVSTLSKSQTDSASLIPGIKAAADSMTTAFRNKDFHTFAHFNNIRLMDMLGGESGFVEFMEKQMALLKDVSFTEMKPGRIIRVLAYSGTHQCIIEQLSEIKMEGLVVSSISHLVGLSPDGGKSWRFADANNGTKEEFAGIMPELSPDLIIPKKKQEMGKTLPELLKDYKTEYLP
jgi:hypothetical protein